MKTIRGIRTEHSESAGFATLWVLTVVGVAFFSALPAYSQADCTPAGFDFSASGCRFDHPTLNLTRNDCDQSIEIVVKAASVESLINPILDYGEWRASMDAETTGSIQLVNLKGRGFGGNIAYQVTIVAPGDASGANEPDPILAVIEDHCPSGLWSVGPSFTEEERSEVRGVLEKELVIGSLGFPLPNVRTECGSALVDANSSHLENRSEMALMAAFTHKFVCDGSRSDWSNGMGNCCDTSDPRCAEDSSAAGVSMINAFGLATSNESLLLEPGEAVQLGPGNHPECCDKKEIYNIYCGGAVVFTASGPGISAQTCSIDDDCPSGETCLDGSCTTMYNRVLNPPIWLQSQDILVKETDPCDPEECSTNNHCPMGETCVNGYCSGCTANPIALQDVRFRCLDFTVPDEMADAYSVNVGTEPYFSWEDENHNGIHDTCGNR